MKSNNSFDISKIKDKELYNLIVTRNGGKTSMMIIDLILVKPSNANQLAKTLGLDYKTIRYHLNIFCSHKYVTKETLDNYSTYFPSDKLIKNIDEYNNIKKNAEAEERLKYEK